MRTLLLLALLLASVSGCCSAPADCTAPVGRASLFAPDNIACRGPYSPGYRRPSYPAYRPIDSASIP